MAAQHASGASSADQQDIFDFFLDSFNDITEQVSKGVHTPSVAFNKISALGVGGIDVWKSYIEGATKVHFEFRVDIAANAVTLMPVKHLSPKFATTSSATTVASSPSTDVMDKASPAKGRVPRPPNAFIIYRQEWHPKVVKDHPDLHNNQISVIIGRKWKAESEAVRHEYKRRAEDAKSRHAVENPGYQYQPRRPSEKRKRMTKNKLAKLRSRKDGGVTIDSMKKLDDMLHHAAANKDVAIDAIQAPDHHYADFVFQNSVSDSGFIIDTNEELEDTLCSQITAWNSSNPRPYSDLHHSATIMSLPLSDGHETHFVPHFALPPNVTEQSGFCGHPIWAPETLEIAFHTNSGIATAELERQNTIADDAFNDLFNFEACTDAESTLEHFHENYTLNFDGGQDVYP